MPLLDQSLILPPEEEFLRFAEHRLEGLQLTEDNHTLSLYEAAKELGLKKLKQKKEVKP